jgi:hypothetical protein
MPDFLADEISNVRPNNPLAFAQAVSNVDVTPEQAAAMGHPPGPGDVQDQHAELMGQPRAPAAAPPPQPTEAQMTAQADKINPILAAFRMRKGSQDLMVDPNAAKAAEEASFADQLKLKQAAPEARMAAAAVEAAKKRTFDESQNALYKSEGLTFDQRKQLAEVGAAGRVNAARASALSPLRADQGNRQDMSTLRQELKDWRARNTFDVDSKTNRRLQTAMGNLTSGNAMQQREAAESLVSIFKGGGQVTKASQDLLLKHLGGIVGDAQSWLEGLSSGHYGSRELGVLKEAANSALDEQKSRMQETYQSAVDDFGPGSAYENMGGNVNHEIKSHFRQFGLDVPDIYSNGAPKVTLGSGSRPTPKKTNPIVKAKKTQNLAAPDKAAVDWANSNPNDPRSAAILRANGL